MPQAVIDKSKFNPFMRDIFTEASPFEIIKGEQDQIVYFRGFKDKETYRPQRLNEDDFDNLEQKLREKQEGKDHSEEEKQNNVKGYGLESVSIEPEQNLN